MTNYRAMVFVHWQGKKPPHWKSIGGWRKNMAEAKADADNHRINVNPVAKIQIHTLTTEVYNG
jgi:hypothetical protein